MPKSSLLLGVAFLCSGNLISNSTAQPDPNWLDHYRNRPAPPVVEPATSSTEDQPGKPPSDATVLFDGKDLSQWVGMDGAPTKWIMRDGYMECVRGSGYAGRSQSLARMLFHARTV